MILVEWITRYGEPHLTWLVAALLVQRDRQRWHHEVARRFLDRDTDERSTQELPGWKFRRHGIGVCMSGPDGERLDVDFNDETGAIIDPWFFAMRVESLRDSTRWVAEARLWRWRPSDGVIVDGLDELVGLGAVHHDAASDHKVVLAPELDARARTVAEDLAAPERATHWLATLEPVDHATHVARHREWIRGRLKTSSRPGQLLDLALEGATDEEAVALCRPLLDRKDWAAGHAIELLRARVRIPVQPAIAQVLRRASTVEDHAFASYQACAYLLERGIDLDLAIERFDVWSRLEKVKGYNANPMLADFVTLALQVLPDRALALIRTALRRGGPICVRQVSALLAAIDQQWCHRELASALADPAGASRPYIAAALRCTSSALAHRRADLRGPSGASHPFTVADFIYANADDVLKYEVDVQQTVAVSLRARYPDDWNGEALAR